MQIIREKIKKTDFFSQFTLLDGLFVKAVVDVEKKLLAVDAGLHVDLEQFLLDLGSSQSDLWGINLFSEVSDDQWIEFDSMINIRPSQNNKSRSVESGETRKKIIDLVNSYIID